MSSTGPGETDLAAPATADDADPGRAGHRRRWILWTGVVGAAVVALVVAGLLRGGSSPTRRPSTPAREFRLQDLRVPEKSVALADFRGRPLVINFFASWCVPCAKEMPAFQQVYQQERSRVAFLGVNHQDSRPDGLEMLRRTGVQYPAASDPDGTVAVAYGLFGMPTTLFVSADGRVVDRHTGELSAGELQKAIDRAFPSRT